MSKDEIEQLLDLRGWGKADLASFLGITENAIYKWFSAGQAPEGPVSILLKEMLIRSKLGLPLLTPEPAKKALVGARR